VRTTIPSQKNPLKQEPDYSYFQVINSQNRTRPADHLSDQDCSTNSQDQPDHTYDWGCFTMHNFVPCLQFFCLLKPIAHDCNPKMAKDELSAYSASSHGMCNKPSFSALTMPLFLAFRGRWPDLAYGISGIWALGPKLQIPLGSVSLSYHFLPWEQEAIQSQSFFLGVNVRTEHGSNGSATNHSSYFFHYCIFWGANS
jgi:hypothetical protein